MAFGLMTVNIRALTAARKMTTRITVRSIIALRITAQSIIALRITAHSKMLLSIIKLIIPKNDIRHNSTQHNVTNHIFTLIRKVLRLYSQYFILFITYKWAQ
jgi:hypothetical protein